MRAAAPGQALRCAPAASGRLRRTHPGLRNPGRTRAHRPDTRPSPWCPTQSAPIDPPLGYSAQDARGVSTGGTDGQPVRTLSTIGLAACSTTPTEAAILPRLVETLSWSVSPAIVPFNDARACSSSATCGPNCPLAAAIRLLPAVSRSCRAFLTPSAPTLVASRVTMALAAVWNSAAAEQSSAE